MSTTRSTPNDTTHSAAVEDYIKHIWKLNQQGDRATTKAIAERLDLGNGTVSGMLKQLAQRGLVEHEPYYGAKLTEAGERLALRIIRRHRLIELFLVETLGLGWDQVDRDAERMEHAVSDDLIDRIDQFLGRPQVDPHGAPIPNADGQVEQQNYHRLSDLKPGQRGLVGRVSDSEPKFLQYLDAVGIGLGVMIEVVDLGPFGAMHVRVGDTESHLAREASQRIHVQVQSPV
ncbi:metal-dependent transcriptional regulator [Planctomycetales bacterium ZRK34]|nr:metal-dependent transcriptional regulator [Planctomycetales bacterium ZRK34]